MASQLDHMRVGVLGSGNVGRRLAGGFTSRGHDVVIGSRDPAKADLREWVAEEGEGVAAGTLAEAAEHGELLALAVLGVAAVDAVEQAGPERFSGKVVIDATNPLDFSQGFPPRLAIGHTDSGGEEIQRAIPEAHVVKAFNTIGNAYFLEPRVGGNAPTMFFCGENADAKRTVAGVLADFGWTDAVDVGGIDASRELESLCILWVRLGGQRGAWDHGFKLLAG